MAVTAPGSPYVESSDLVANYPGVSESLAERVDLVGVLPFADSTARGTALPSPTDGQYSYLQDTNATEYYNGSAWVAAGATPGLVHINTTTFSAVSSVSLDNVFTSDYENYKIMMFSTNSVQALLNFRYRASGTDNSGALYYMRGVNQGAVTTTEVNLVTLHEIIQTGIETTSFTMDLFNPQETKFTSNAYIAGSLAVGILGMYRTGSGTYGATTAFDGFTLSLSTGNMTGTIRVYGYSNGA
jgi:hypothetical protein